MEKGQSFILLRYSNNIVSDTIKQHQDVIEKIGFCWFGKIGVVPSKKIQKAILAEDNPRIILYTRGIAHECHLLEISEKRPSKGCPDYYEIEGICPSVYFKLASIEPIKMSELDNYSIISTGRKLLDAIWHSMTSYFFAEWSDGKKTETDIKQKKQQAEEEKQKTLQVNDCIYRKNGRCSLRSCVNYQYECDRPNMCLKQKL